MRRLVCTRQYYFKIEPKHTMTFELYLISLNSSNLKANPSIYLYQVWQKLAWIHQSASDRRGWRQRDSWCGVFVVASHYLNHLSFPTHKLINIKNFGASQMIRKALEKYQEYYILKRLWNPEAWHNQRKIIFQSEHLWYWFSCTTFIVSVR